jgi:hypothetical protein
MLAASAMLLLTSCFGGGGDITRDPAEARRQVTGNLNQISINLSAEQVFEASNYVHDSFELQPEVARKFNVGPFEGKGRAAFRAFFERVAEKYGDITLQFTVQRIDVEDSVATAYVRVTFSADDIESAPPSDVSFTENDVFVFEWNGQTYALINWGENPHDQGGGGGF